MSLLEITIAFAILISALSGMILLIYLDQQWLLIEPIKLVASSKIHQIINQERQLAHHNFDDVVSTTTVDGVYTEKIKEFLMKNDLKQIEVELSWPPQGFLRGGYLSEVATVADWSVQLDNPTCHITQGQFILKGSLTLSASTTATDIEVRHNIVYLTADSAIKSKSDFYIVDASNKDRPIIISEIDTGPGLMALAVHDNYAYVANTSINGQLQIIDIHDINRPILLKTYKLSGDYGDSGSVGNSIYYHQGYVYLGLKKSSTAELHIVDVSDPTTPKEVGQWEANTTIHSIIANDNLIYIASPDDSELRILDARDLSHVSEIADFNALGGSGNGKALYQDGGTIYLGRTFGNSELAILDIKNGEENVPRILTSASISLKTSVEDILVASTTAFLATLDPTKQIQIWNVTDQSKPVFKNSLQLPATPTALACDSQSIFAALASSTALVIISQAQ